MKRMLDKNILQDSSYAISANCPVIDWNIYLSHYLLQIRSLPLSGLECSGNIPSHPIYYNVLPAKLFSNKFAKIGLENELIILVLNMKYETYWIASIFGINNKISCGFLIHWQGSNTYFRYIIWLLATKKC